MTNAHEIQGRQADRDKLAREVAEFEARGGVIERLTPGGVPRDDDDSDLIDV